MVETCTKVKIFEGRREEVFHRVIEFFTKSKIKERRRKGIQGSTEMPPKGKVFY